MSLDHSIRSRQNIRWNGQTDLLGGFQIDHELELGWLLYRQVARPGTFEKLIHVRGGSPKQVGNAHAIAHKPALSHKFARKVHRGQLIFYRELCNLPSPRIEGRTSQHEHCVSKLFVCGSEYRLDILWIQYPLGIEA